MTTKTKKTAKAKKAIRNPRRSRYQRYQDLVKKYADELGTEFVTHVSQWLTERAAFYAAKLVKQAPKCLYDPSEFDGFHVRPADVDTDILLGLDSVDENVDDVGPGLYCHVKLDVDIPEPR